MEHGAWSTEKIMIRARLIHIILIVAAFIMLAGCSNTKYLTGDQLLYTGREIVYISDTTDTKDFHVRQVAESVTSYKPNNSIGGKRILPPVGLWVFNSRKTDDTTKSRGWFYKTLAKEPVLVSVVNPEMRCRKLESELFGNGYFHAAAKYDIDTAAKDPRKAAIVYYVIPGTPFVYNEILFAPPEDSVDTIINSYQPALAIKSGEVFNLETARAETKKMTDRVLEGGYFYFSQANIKYTADTVRKPNSIDLLIGKTLDQAPNAGSRYFIGRITVRISGESDMAGLQVPDDTVIYDGIRIISKGMPFKPAVFSRSVYFREGDRYSLSKHRQTMTHLNSYGVFKFINVRYMPDHDSLVKRLDMLIELTPAKEIGLDLEANVVTKSTGFSGPGFSATLSHGNLARGANKLQLKLDGGMEWQWGSTSPSALGTFSYNVGLSSSITFPRMLLPFGIVREGRFNLPQTSITMGFEFLNKIQYYRMGSVNLGFGYQWKKPDRITHIYYPIFVNSINLRETTPEFDSLMNANPYIRKSFEEQFIVGMKYDFIYDNSITKQPHGFYFQAGISTSGNLLGLFKNISSDEEERPYTFRGSVYSQFMKLTSDVRYYRNFREMSFAFRFYSGVGIPYSNSVVMPYVEQFYSGGSNSIRAFIARSVGPGTVRTEEDAEIIDQTGDIKLEGNFEFRFGISKILRGALFLDAGNVWLLNPDETRPGAEFSFSTFADQLAVGTGVGLRFDFSFFVLRTDLGFPLRTPYVDNGSNWIQRGSDSWHDKVFSLAIGYPF
jgi:outer membrane protein assembly factor BamA